MVLVYCAWALWSSLASCDSTLVDSKFIMKRHKSRTFIGRTLSRVKSRITSFGSVSESPNPLIAPPSRAETLASPTRAPRTDRVTLHRRVDDPSVKDAATYLRRIEDLALPRVDGIAETGNLPGDLAVAALQFKVSTWTVFGTHPKYSATAYVNIDLACEGNTIKREQGAIHQPTTEQSVGHLHDLSIETTITGPGILIKQYGHPTRSSLALGERWLLVQHIGIRDTSLASKLSTSFRSLGGRLGRLSNIEVINHWLDVLHKDTMQAESGRQTLQVAVRVEFRHSLLPGTTLLVEERGIEVAVTEDQMEQTKLDGIRLDSAQQEQEDEERLREMRVLGAPWL